MTNMEFLGKYISFLSRYCQMYLDSELQPYRIGSGQFYLLMPLFETDGIPQESLSQIIKVDKATVTRSLQKLIDEGYVYRERDEEDKRAYRVFLTEKGRTIQSDIIKIACGWEEILLSGFTVEERKIIANSFANMIENASRIMEK